MVKKNINIKKWVIRLYISLHKFSGRKVVNFIHIGKTAGTAIRNAIIEKKGFTGKVLVSNGYLFHLRGHNYKLNQVGKDEYVFFVVRDPLKRFVSGFYSRKRKGRPANNNPWSKGEKEAFGHFSTPNQLGEALSGNEQEIAAAKKALHNIGHVNSSYWDWFFNEKYLLENKDRILAVLKQETLQHDFENFKKERFVNIGTLPKDEIKSHKSPQYFDKGLSSRATLNLKKWFAKEYNFLNILYENGLINQKYPLDNNKKR